MLPDNIYCNHPSRVRSQERAPSIVMGSFNSCDLLWRVSDFVLNDQGPCLVFVVSGCRTVASTVPGPSGAIREGEGC
jgi:hypothetical protein